MKTKKLMRSHNNRYLTGVLGGIAEYFGWNAKYLRIGYLVLAILTVHTSILILLYLLLTVLMPVDYGQSNDRKFGGFNSFGTSMNRDERPAGRKILHGVEEKDEPKK